MPLVRAGISVGPVRARNVAASGIFGRTAYLCRMRFLGFHSLVAVSLGLATGQALATEHEVSTYGPILDACYDAADGTEALAACKGQMAESCMATQDGGYTTLGMSLCAAAEADVWDKYLNSEYKTTMAWAKSADEDEAVYFPGYANRAESLLNAQRAWIAFRDAECALAYASWGSGSMRSIAGAGCRLEMTADRALELRSLREDFE